MPRAESCYPRCRLRGRIGVLGAQLLRWAAGRLRGQGHEHRRRPAWARGLSSLVDSLSGPGHRGRRRGSATATGSWSHGALIDGRPGPQRGGIGRRRLSRRVWVAALQVERGRPRGSTVRRQPVVRARNRMPGVGPCQDLGAEPPVEAGRLFGSSVYGAKWNAARSRLDSRSADRLRPSTRSRKWGRASGCSSEHGAVREPDWKLRHHPWDLPCRSHFSLRGGPIAGGKHFDDASTIS
jgi:hypothetical protein